MKLDNDESDVTKITEVLPDGTIYYVDLEVCNDESEALLTTLMEKEGQVLGFDAVSAVFNLFVNCVHILTTCGWTTDELIEEVLIHTEDDSDDFIDFGDDADD